MVGGAVSDGHLFDDVLAFGMTLCMAIMMLIIRQHRATPMLPAACLSAATVPTDGLAVRRTARRINARPAQAVPVRHNAVWSGLVFLTVVVVSATENALMNTLVKQPAVAAGVGCFSEVPSVANFTGGMIVMAAVVGHVWLRNWLRPLDEAAWRREVPRPHWWSLQGGHRPQELLPSRSPSRRLAPKSRASECWRFPQCYPPPCRYVAME